MNAIMNILLDIATRKITNLSLHILNIKLVSHC